MLINCNSVCNVPHHVLYSSSSVPSVQGGNYVMSGHTFEWKILLWGFCLRGNSWSHKWQWWCRKDSRGKLLKISKRSQHIEPTQQLKADAFHQQWGRCLWAQTDKENCENAPNMVIRGTNLMGTVNPEQNLLHAAILWIKEQLSCGNGGGQGQHFTR